ncbi:copper resistance CopC family protein [Cumulibacter manganitolerans]|uniref:copper resistance CopC family protein n=1 Tax=Cumulibacter manganitolerans TaxID=1884992 RepID=UPI0018862D9D|nr:copper resistance CopC family protein [Cumulibacter manganitolerans]
MKSPRTAVTRPAPGRRAALRLVTALLATVAAVLLGTGTAFAHTELASSDPADGATLDVLPGTITLTFGETLQGPTAKVGVLVGDRGPVQVDATVSGATVTVDTAAGPIAGLLSDGGSGKWAISYQVVSEDGHRVDGTLTFTVAAPASPTGTGAAATSSAEAATAAGASGTHADRGEAAGDPAAAGDDEPEQVDPLTWFLIVAGVAAGVFAVVRIDRAVRKKKADATEKDA